MKHYIATNRKVIYNGNKYRITNNGYTPPSLELRFARYDTEEKDYDVLDDIESQNISDLGHVDYSKTQTGSSEMFREIFKHLKSCPADGQHDLLIYVHGAANREKDIKEHFEQLQKNMVEHGPIDTIVMFYWTTNGKVTCKEHKMDMNDAVAAGQALSRLYLKLLLFFRHLFNEENETPCQQNIHLMCHSMGNQVLEHMISTIKMKMGTPDAIPFLKLFKEILLIAPDVDYDIFEEDKAFSDLNELGQRTYIYCHRKDTALKLARTFIHKKKRLGSITNPKKLPQVSNVYFADAQKGDKEEKSNLQDWDVFKDEVIVQHRYHHYTGKIAKDIANVLEGSHSQYKIEIKAS